MKKNLILILIIGFNYQSVKSQNIIVNYEYNSFGGRLKYDTKLIITEKKSQFYVNFDGFKIEENGRQLEFHGRNYVLNYEYASNKYTELKYLDNYEVKASWNNDQEWQILDETKTILGYNVRKAQIKKRNQIMYV